ncbi:hypothetical protein JHK87_022628 [Glycine soja]|nr:hypothetical protein JHK87_022628 [Glycine soja]
MSWFFRIKSQVENYKRTKGIYLLFSVKEVITCLILLGLRGLESFRTAIEMVRNGCPESHVSNSLVTAIEEFVRKGVDFTQQYTDFIPILTLRINYSFTLSASVFGAAYISVRQLHLVSVEGGWGMLGSPISPASVFGVIMENGIIRVSLSKPEGTVLGISYNGIDNVLERRNKFNNRGIQGSKFSVIEASENQVEVSFTRTWDMDSSSLPLNIDKRYILRRGSSGLYIYAIFEHPKDFPALEIDHIRIVFKLQRDRFHYMAIADDRQRVMPTAEDRSKGRRLDFDEAVLITNPSNPELQGEVDDKYQYSCENKDNKVHGWINLDSNSNESVGFWMITPSNEFRSGGPIKQGLTSHVGPTTLNILHTTHYSGKEVTMALKEGEPFKKVYGPVFAYLNSVSSGHDSQALWSDAVQQLSEEIKSWPYDFPNSEEFFPANKRGRVEGRLLVQDRHIQGGNFVYGDNAYVGLALPGDVGSWQRQSKVRLNNPVARPPHFSTGLIGRDNSVARHGIHGLHRPYSIEVPSYLLVEGTNTIYLRQSKGLSPFLGVMYDYIRLERPET